jgi:hypothetical protein
MGEVGSKGEGKEWVRSGRGAEQVVRGGNLNPLDYQTAVHERRAYMLYSRTRNKLMKRESTEGGRQKNGRQGTCGTTSKYEGEDVWKYYDKKGRRQGRRGVVMRRRRVVMGGAAKHVLAGPRLCWCQWQASYGERYEKHHALLRTGDGTVLGRAHVGAVRVRQRSGRGRGRNEWEMTYGPLRS